MSIAILIGITVGDGLAPGSATLEVDVVDVGACVDNIDIDALATVGGVEVLVKVAEAQAVAVRDTGKTPWCVLLELSIVFESVDFLVLLNELDL